MFIIVDRLGQLTIDGEDLQSPCLKILNLHELRSGLDLVGSDTPVAGGQFIANPRVPTPTTVTLRAQLAGDVDHTGSAYPDAVNGWNHNLWYHNQLLGPGDGDGRRHVVLTWGGGSYVYYGDCHVGFMKAGELLADGTTAVTFDITLLDALVWD